MQRNKQLFNVFFLIFKVLSIFLGGIVPGEKGGGQLPDFATASLQTLIPTDLTAVSVFNFVFASARSLTAEAVIFSEIQEIKNLTDSSTYMKCLVLIFVVAIRKKTSWSFLFSNCNNDKTKKYCILFLVTS